MRNFESVSIDSVVGIRKDWHRGAAVEVAGLALNDMLEATGLNWEVKTSGFRYGQNYEHRQTDTKIAYREDTGMYIDTYTDRQPWQNAEIVGHFHDFCEASNLSLSHLGSLQDGKVVFAAAKLPIEIDVAKAGDITEGYLLLKDSHLNGKGLSVSLFLNRMVCTNGLHSAVREGRQVISHIGEFNKARVSGIFDAALATIQEKQQQADALAAVQMTREEAVVHLITAFGVADKPVEDQPKLIQTVLALFDGQAQGSEYMSAYKTAYGLLQATTEYFNWHAPARGTNQSQFQSILSGSRGSKMGQFERQLVGVCLG